MSDRVTAMDVEQQEFRSRLRGFDPDEVRLYLKSVAEEIGRLNLENSEAREKLGALRAEVEELRARERTLQQTLVAAQRMSEEMKDKARAEGQLVIREAQLRADQIVRQAQDQLARIEGEIASSRMERDTIERRLRSVIDQHLALLDMRKETRSDSSNVRGMPPARIGTEAG